MSNLCQWCGGDYHTGSLYKKTEMHYACHITCRRMQERSGLTREQAIGYHAPTSDAPKSLRGKQVITVRAFAPGAVPHTQQHVDQTTFQWGLDRVHRIAERFVGLWRVLNFFFDGGETAPGAAE